MSYSQSKIYKLWCDETEMVFVCSTTQSLDTILDKHKNYYTNCPSKILFELSENVKVELLEEFSCANQMELNYREMQYKNCMNNLIPSVRRPAIMRVKKEKKVLQRRWKEFNNT